jgi:hypothetical protein
MYVKRKKVKSVDEDMDKFYIDSCYAALFRLTRKRKKSLYIFSTDTIFPQIFST